MKNVVIYHANCADGFGAAFAAWTKLGDAADYLPMNYNEPLHIPVEWHGANIYVVDFSFPPEVMRELRYVAACLVWLDHHKTAFEHVGATGGSCEIDEGPDGYTMLDDSKSGALLAWEYFQPGVPAPLLIRCIDDRDRWQFKIEHSRALHAGLMSERPWTFQQWFGLTPMSPAGDEFWSVVARGRILLGYDDQQIRSTASKAAWCQIEGCDMGMAVNATAHLSEVGNALAKRGGTYGLVWYYDAESGRANCSLRSEGEYDVSEIAKRFGGGGHRNAAGFNIDMPTLLGWLS